LFNDFLTLFGFGQADAFFTLALAAFIGGLVRGFTGFGFAMVFVPLATIAVGPVMAAALIWIIDFPFAWILAASSWRRVAWREIAPLLTASILFLPLGVWLLTHSDPVTARWCIALAILLGVTALATGWRYRGSPGLPLSFGVGGAAGIASGMAQLGGMPIAIFWLAAQKNDPRQTRDNLNGFFCLLPTVAGIAYLLSGVLTVGALKMAVPLAIPYGLGLAIGARAFPFASEQTFRRVAYLVIFMAAVVALPVIDPVLGR
jgi:uncharacterized membrane protein YfcA